MSISKIKSISKYSQKKFRKLENHFLIEGWRSVEELLLAKIEIEKLILNSDLNLDLNKKTLLKKLKNISCNIIELPKKEFSKITDTVNSQGIIAEIKKINYDLEKILSEQKSKSTIIALDRISDPGNLGTIIRICDWFNVDALLIGSGSVELYNPKVIRSTVGSIFHFPILENVDLSLSLKKLKNYKIISADLNGTSSIDKYNFSEKICIIIGSEAHGISSNLKNLITDSVSIPKFGKVESLNAAVALSIFLTKRFI